MTVISPNTLYKTVTQQFCKKLVYQTQYVGGITGLEEIYVQVKKQVIHGSARIENRMGMVISLNQ